VHVWINKVDTLKGIQFSYLLILQQETIHVSIPVLNRRQGYISQII